jgi:hypothetical protein
VKGIPEVLGDICLVLRQRNFGHALLGGLAVAVRAEPRFTRDIDLAVAVDDDPQAEALVRHTASHGYQIQMIVEQEETGRLATVRILPPGEPQEGLIVDLLFASSGIEGEIVAQAEPVQVFQDLVMPVCRSGHLLALKILARDDVRRPQDIIDIRALLRTVDSDELAVTRKALQLIMERGFHRGRDLTGALEELLRK